MLSIEFIDALFLLYIINHRNKFCLLFDAVTSDYVTVFLPITYRMGSSSRRKRKSASKSAKQREKKRVEKLAAKKQKGEKMK